MSWPVRASTRTDAGLERNSRSLRGLELDGVSELLESANKSACGAGLVLLIEVGRSEVAVHGTVAEHVVGGREQRGGDGDRGLLRAASCA